MTEAPTTTLEETKRRIHALDFSKIMDKMVHQGGWKPAQVQELAKQYRRYLFLLKKYPEQTLPPSEDMDEFWHSHILDTKAYRADCDKIFGRYVDHYPYLGMDGVTPMSEVPLLFHQTKTLYRKEFGEDLHSVRHKGINRALIGLFTWLDKTIERFGLRRRITLTIKELNS